MLWIPILFGWLAAFVSHESADSLRLDDLYVLRDDSGTVLTQIPFDLNFNHPYVEVRINGSEPLSFILDTGAQVLMIDREAAKRIGLDPKPLRSATGGAGGGRVQLSTLGNLDLEIGGLPMKVDVAYSFSIDDLMSRHEGRPVHGLLGYDFMSRYVVEMDHGGEVIRLFDPERYTYSGDGTVIPIVIANNHPRVEAGLDFVSVDTVVSVEGTFVLDSGATGPVYLSTDFVAAHGLLRLGLPTRTAFVAGIGGLSDQQVARSERLKFGGLEVGGSPVYLSQDKSGGLAGQLGVDGVIGTEILRRYKVIWDYQGSRVILEPNSHQEDPFVYDIVDLTGFYLMTRGPDSDRVWVEEIVQDGPADAAGVRPGDLLVAIDGDPINLFTMEQIRRLFLLETTYRLTVDRKGQTLEIVLPLKSSF